MGKTLTNKTNFMLKILFVLAMLLGSFSFARVDAQTLINTNDKVTIQIANNTSNGQNVINTLHINVDGVSLGTYTFNCQGTGNVTIEAKDGYSITSMTVSSSQSSDTFVNESAIDFGNHSHIRTLNITTTTVASLSYIMYFTAGDHVTLSVPSGFGYNEIIANKSYSVTVSSNAVLPTLPTATAEEGYETPTWSPTLPSTLTSDVNNQTYTATTVAKTVYTLSYNFGTASMHSGDDGLTPAVPASQNAYAGDTLIVADNVNLVGNSDTHAFFLYWSTTRNNTGPGSEVYYPGDSITMTASLVLYPIFGIAPVVVPTTYIGNYYVHTVTGVPTDNPQLEPRDASDYKSVGTGTIALPPYNITGSSNYKAYYTGSDLTSSGYLLTIPSYTTADLNAMFNTTFPDGTSIVWYVIKDQPWESNSSRYHIDGYIILPEAIDYSVTFTIDSSFGSLSGTTSYSVEENTLLSDTVTVIPTVLPNAGYGFDEWQLVGTATTFANNADLTTYLSTHNATTDLEFKAVLSTNNYALTFKANDNVTLTVPSGAGYVEVTAGKEYTLAYDVNSILPTLPTATADTGYDTPTWSPTLPTALSVIINGYTYIASTEATEYGITFKANDHVTLTVPSGAGYVEVIAGKEYTLAYDVNSLLPTLPTATADTGYDTPTWDQTLPTTLWVGINGYTYIASTEATEYTLTFKAEDHVTLTVPSIGYTEVTVGKEYTLAYDVTTTLPTLPTATADTGYDTPTWGPALPTALSIGLDGTTYTASTEATQYTLNINYVFSGSIKPATGYANVINQIITIEDSFNVVSPAAPANHTVNIASVTVDHPTANISVTVTYTIIPVITHTINFLAGVGGTLSGTTSYTFVSGTVFGSAVSTVPTPVALINYNFVGWSPLLPASDTAIEADITYTAIFEFVPPVVPAETYTIEFTAGDGGSLTGITTISVDEGTVFGDVTIPTPVAEDGYEFDAWTPIFPTDETEITGDLSFVANFNEVAEVLEPETPVTPEAAGVEGCWIHWPMLILTLLYGLYEGIRLSKKEENDELKNAEKGENN